MSRYGHRQSPLQLDATAKGQLAKLHAYNQGYRGKQLTHMKELMLEADPSEAAQLALRRIRSGQRAAKSRKLNKQYGPVQGPVYRKTNRKVGTRLRKRVPRLAKRGRKLPARTPMPLLGNPYTVGVPQGIMRQNVLTPQQAYAFL
jgi:hypothetical protein